MIKNGMRPVHPGEVLREDYLVPLGTSANALARALNVPAPRINDRQPERVSPEGTAEPAQIGWHRDGSLRDSLPDSIDHLEGGDGHLSGEGG